VTQLETQVAGVLDLLASELDKVQHADPATRDASLAALHQKINELRHGRATVPSTETPLPDPLPDNESPSTP
jgi:hypothetical protein